MSYFTTVRTTLALEDDVFAYARAHALRENVSIGQAVSRLARLGIRAQAVPPVTRSLPSSKFALLPARDEVITTEHVRALMDQEAV